MFTVAIPALLQANLNEFKKRKKNVNSLYKTKTQYCKLIRKLDAQALIIRFVIVLIHESSYGVSRVIVLYLPQE